MMPSRALFYIPADISDSMRATFLYISVKEFVLYSSTYQYYNVCIDSLQRTLQHTLQHTKNVFYIPAHINITMCALIQLYMQALSFVFVLL